MVRPPKQRQRKPIPTYYDTFSVFEIVDDGETDLEVSTHHFNGLFIVDGQFSPSLG